MSPRLRAAIGWIGAALWIATLAAVATFVAYVAVTFAWALIQFTLTAVWGVDLS